MGEAVTLRRLLDGGSRSASEQDERDAPVAEPAEAAEPGRDAPPRPAAALEPAAGPREDEPRAMRDSPQGTSQRSWARERLTQQARRRPAGQAAGGRCSASRRRDAAGLACASCLAGRAAILTTCDTLPDRPCSCVAQRAGARAGRGRQRGGHGQPAQLCARAAAGRRPRGRGRRAAPRSARAEGRGAPAPPSRH